jgi:two-component system, chemotaxis family, chemotaxis protein CheY
MDFRSHEVRTMKALVVDDSSTMRKIILRSLEAVGVTGAAEAGDGNQALSYFKENPVDIVLTDWNMPGKNGLELVKDIRAAGSQVPIIMLTTEAERQRVLDAVAAGVSDYLIKPFTPEALRDKLNKFVTC